MDERRRGDSVDLDEREIVARARVCIGGEVMKRLEGRTSLETNGGETNVRV